MNLKSYKGNVRQSFIQILNQAVSEGITDIRLLQQKLHNQFADDVRNGRMAMSKEARIAAKKAKQKQITNKFDTSHAEKCPSCGRKNLVTKRFQNEIEKGTLFEEGILLVCKDCRWSEIVQLSEVSVKKVK